jgi:hypothetical protein
LESKKFGDLNIHKNNLGEELGMCLEEKLTSNFYNIENNTLLLFEQIQKLRMYEDLNSSESKNSPMFELILKLKKDINLYNYKNIDVPMF